MATISIDDPDVVRKARVDDRGRVYVGNEYNGMKVRIVMEVIDSDGVEGSN